jgi:hypothetical protein
MRIAAPIQIDEATRPGGGCPVSGFSELGGLRRVPAAHAMLRHTDLIEQIGVTVQHFEQLDQGQ